MNEVPLTFGQKAALRAEQRSRAPGSSESLITSVNWLAPPHLGAEEVRAALRELASHHDALRTTFADVRSAEPVQILSDDPELSPPSRFSPVDDGQRCWGARVTSGPGQCGVALFLHRVIADEFSVNLVIRDLETIAAGEAVRASRSPRELAVEQRSPSWRKRRSAAARYWERIADEARPLAEEKSPPAEDAVVGFAAIPASHHRLADTAAQLGLAPGGMLAVVLARVLLETLDANLVPVSVQFSNRTGSGLDRMMGNQSQAVPVLFRADEIRGASLANLAESTRWKLVHAQRHGMYDPDVPGSVGWNESPAGNLVNYTETSEPDAKPDDRLLRRVFRRPASGLNGGVVVSVKNAHGSLRLGIRGSSRAWDHDVMSRVLDRFVGAVQGTLPEPLS